MSVDTDGPDLWRRLLDDGGELSDLVDQAEQGRTWQLSGRIASLSTRGPRNPEPPLSLLRAKVATLKQRLPENDLTAIREALRGIEDAFRSAQSTRSYRLARWAARVHNLRYARGLEPGPMERIPELLGSMFYRVEYAVQAVVDVVVPVYGEADLTLRCLESVLSSSNSTPYELIVIDDGNRDSELLARLEALRASGQIQVVRNSKNRGYTASANRGLCLHRGRDVVLLNSDARVHGDWLDRLRRAAYSDWRISTATPFSNCAEICSYPELGSDEGLPADLDLAAMDSAFASLNSGQTFTLPTNVGFCTYMRRSCLNVVGLFDEGNFPRGYGEENDFSMRARSAGWRHVIAADTFVEHSGGASFGQAKAELIRAAVARVTSIHASYLVDVNDFLREDPLLEARRRVDLARMSSMRASVLMVTHALGGGTERHVRELVSRLEASGLRTIVLRPEGQKVRLELASMPSIRNLVFALPAEDEALLETLRKLGVALVHIHHLQGLPDRIAALPRDLEVPYDVTLHDYLAICPRVHLVDGSGFYCGEPAADVCNTCIKSNGSVLGRSVEIGAHRSRSKAFLTGARRLFVPSSDVAERMQRYLPEREFAVRPHFPVRARDIPTPPASAKTLRIAVIGAIGVEKGVEVLKACLQDADKRKLNIHFHLIGYSDRDSDLRQSGRITISGRYAEDEVFELLEESASHAAFLPSVWPETFSYALSIAFAAGLQPVCFDMGAQAERIGQTGFGQLLPLDSTPSSINDALLALAAAGRPNGPLLSADREYADIWADYYGAPFKFDELALESDATRALEQSIESTT